MARPRFILTLEDPALNSALNDICKLLEIEEACGWSENGLSTASISKDVWVFGVADNDYEAQILAYTDYKNKLCKWRKSCTSRWMGKITYYDVFYLHVIHKHTLAAIEVCAEVPRGKGLASDVIISTLQIYGGVDTRRETRV